MYMYKSIVLWNNKHAVTIIFGVHIQYMYLITFVWHDDMANLMSFTSALTNTSSVILSAHCNSSSSLPPLVMTSIILSNRVFSSLMTEGDYTKKIDRIIENNYMNIHNFFTFYTYSKPLIVDTPKIWTQYNKPLNKGHSLRSQ